MAASELTSQEIDRDAGTEITLAAANADGNYYTNGTTRCLRIANGGAGNITLTVAIPGSIDGVAKADKTYTIANDSAVYEFSPFPASIYGGTVNLSYSAVTSVTVAVVHFDAV